MQTIKFTSRMSVKIGDSYFTFEATMEKTVPPNLSNEEYLEFKHNLWNECNSEVDLQIKETYDYIKNNKNKKQPD